MAAISIKRILKTGLLGLSIFYMLSMLWLFSKRLVYPYELDWIEGGLLTSVLQILDGNPLYAAPSVGYVPFLYAPSFFYLAALAAKIMGPGLLALRLVSVAATLVSLVTIALIVFGETKSWFWGIVSAGLFAGLYPASRFWYDLGRVDMVFVMFFLLFLFSLRRGYSPFWQVAAGVFAALTILTKQNGFMMCLPIIAVYFLLGWRKRFILPLAFLLVYGGISLAFVFSTDGWYLYYCYSVAFLQPNGRTSYSFFDFVKGFIYPNLALAALLSLFAPALWFFRGEKEHSVFWLVVLVSTVLTSYLAKANVGGVNNVVIPTFAIFSLLLGVGLAEISKKLQESSSRQQALGEVFCCLLALLQLGQMIYNPSHYLPPIEDYASGSKALKFVKKFDGNVYVPNSSILLMAGKKTFAHPSAMWDVMHTYDDARGRDILLPVLQQAVAAHFFDAIVILPDFDYFPDLQKYYALDRSKYILLDDNWKEKADIYVLP